MREAPREVARDSGRNGRPVRERLERRRQSVLEHRRMQAAGQLTQLGQGLGERGAGAVEQLGRRRIVAESRCSRRSCIDMATSRCWAPSCRLRSRRRRSTSPAVTSRSRDSLSSLRRCSASVRSCRFSSATAVAAAAASSNSGSSSSAMSWTIAATGRPLSSTGVTARPDPATVGPRSTASTRSGSPSARRSACCMSRALIVPRPRSSSARPPRARRERSRPARKASGTSASEHAVAHTTAGVLVPRTSPSMPAT